MFDYYKAPPQEVFEDIKKNAIKIWEGYSDEFGYRSEKIDRIKDLENIQDNAWVMVAMFDPINIAILLSMVELETAKMIQKARGVNFGREY